MRLFSGKDIQIDKTLSQISQIIWKRYENFLILYQFEHRPEKSGVFSFDTFRSSKSVADKRLGTRNFVEKMTN